MFSIYPDIKEAYWLSQHLRAIFSNSKSTADTARLNLARWYNRVAQSGFKAFRAKLHGVNDTKLFIFRLCKLYA